MYFFRYIFDLLCKRFSSSLYIDLAVWLYFIKQGESLFWELTCCKQSVLRRRFWRIALFAVIRPHRPKCSCVGKIFLLTWQHADMECCLKTALHLPVLYGVGTRRNASRRECCVHLTWRRRQENKSALHTSKTSGEKSLIRTWHGGEAGRGERSNIIRTISKSRQIKSGSEAVFCPWAPFPSHFSLYPKLSLPSHILSQFESEVHHATVAFGPPASPSPPLTPWSGGREEERGQARDSTGAACHWTDYLGKI
jgi:hypothetical protein